MKNFLTKNWVGVLCIFLTALICSLIYTFAFMEGFRKYAPQFIQEATAFLPITIENGEIVAPKDTIIKKSYTSSETGYVFDVVLDTTTDEYSSSFSSNEGFYINKKCIYSKTKQEVKATCFNDVIDKVIIDENFLNSLSDGFNKNGGKYIALCLWLAFVIVYYIAILLYSLVIKLLLSIWFKCSFKQVLLVNSLIYSLFEIASILALFECGVWTRLAVFILINTFILHKIKNEG